METIEINSAIIITKRLLDVNRIVQENILFTLKRRPQSNREAIARSLHTSLWRHPSTNNNELRSFVKHYEEVLEIDL